MNEKDRFDWNDGPDTEPLSDEAVADDCFAEPLDDSELDDYSAFADFSDDYDLEESPNSVPADEADEPKPEQGPGKPDWQGSRLLDESASGPESKGRFLTLLMVAGLGTVALASVGATLLVVGESPATLWQPDGLTEFGHWLDFQQYPQNALYLVALATVLLMALVGGSLLRVIQESTSQTRANRRMLARVASLRLDREQDWQNPDFKADPALAVFTAETLGAWRHQDAKLRRLTGIEGELRRLEKALAAGSRDDLAAKFDSPAVGILADSALRVNDERDQARSDQAAAVARYREEGEKFIQQIQVARHWHCNTLDNLGVQETTLTQVVDGILEAARQAAQMGPDTGALDKLIAGLKKDMAGSAAGGLGKQATQLNDLVEKASKIAFQIAMEVARLGPKGERLLPMAQSLEELNTSFRQVADQAGAPRSSSSTGDDANASSAKFDQLTRLVAEAGGDQFRQLAGSIQKLGAATGQVAGNLERMGRGFDSQHENLKELGSICSDLSGAHFDPEEDLPDLESAENGSETLELVQLDPFQITKGPDGGAFDVDPFATPQSEIDAATPDMPALEITTSITPGVEETYRPIQPVQEQPVAPEPVPANDRVFEMSELGGVTVDQEVHELSDFGAVRVDEPDQKPAPAEEIHELSEFGAVRLD